MRKYLVAIQLFSRIRLFVTPWTAARHVSLPFTMSWSLLKLMSTESVMASNHVTLCRNIWGSSNEINKGALLWSVNWRLVRLSLARCWLWLRSSEAQEQTAISHEPSWALPNSWNQELSNDEARLWTSKSAVGTAPDKPGCPVIGRTGR